MEYIQNIQQCLASYRESVLPMVSEENYWAAGMEAGTVRAAVDAELAKHVGEMPLRLRTYLIGFRATLKLLETDCLENNVTHISASREQVDERLPMLELILDSLAKAEGSEIP